MTDAATDSVVEFPILRKCPYEPPAEYGEMLASGGPSPIRLYNGTQGWLVTGYDDAKAVLSDPLFSSDATNPGYPMLSAAMEGTRAFSTLITLDAPEHTRLRRTVISEFTVRRMNGLRPLIQRTADELIDAMLAADKPVDLVQAYSTPMAGSVICHLLGISYADMQEFVAKSQDVPLETSDSLDADDVGSAMNAHLVPVTQYLYQAIMEKEREPGDDLLSRVIAKHVATGTLTHAELVNLCFLFFGAGQLPTASMISLGVAALLENPEQLAALRADEAVLPGAVDELLRYVSVSDLSGLRVATADVEIGGVAIAAGDPVIVANGAANRDTEVFDEPNVLDVHRNARAHIAFGHGSHQCLGANLTRVELEIAYGTLFRRIPGLRLAVPASELTGLPGSPLPDIMSMPVTW
ncbi:cytochrome P450 [Saccharomonospora xinjiangensis]|uniref:cytochrome P450 n=1 Tax=Saccharomonospora xinjiangensis TaxID=75294 RepID=UPI00350FC712